MVRMKHPLHGWHHAYTITDQTAMEKNGWTVDVPEPVAEPEADPSEADAAGHTVESVRAQLDAAVIPYDKRLGLTKLLALLPE